MEFGGPVIKISREIGVFSYLAWSLEPLPRYRCNFLSFALYIYIYIYSSLVFRGWRVNGIGFAWNRVIRRVRSVSGITGCPDVEANHESHDWSTRLSWSMPRVPPRRAFGSLALVLYRLARGTENTNFFNSNPCIALTRALENYL